MEQLLTNKKIIAISGMIGSGKSTALWFLKENNFCVIDCDLLSREVAEDKEVVKQIAACFGDEFVCDGKILRAKLAERVFKNQSSTAKLNEIFHKEVFELLRKRIDEAESATVFVEIQVLEKTTAEFFDEIWLIVASEDEIVGRVSRRDGRSQSTTENILRRQEENLEFLKINFASKIRIIVNDGDVKRLFSQINDLVGCLA